MTQTSEKRVHEGRNIKRFREMLGIKQEALAWELGEDWNQKKVSLMEAREQVDTELLARVSHILKIPVEAFKTFDEEQMINIVSNTFTSNDSSTLNAINPNCTFNPLDKLVEAYEEIKRLNAELLKEKDEKIRLLERMLEKG